MHRAITTKQLAERWSCSISTITRMLKAGALDGFRLTHTRGRGGSWRIKLSEVERFEAEGARGKPVQCRRSIDRLPLPRPMVGKEITDEMIERMAAPRPRGRRRKRVSE